jgi:uncharacterized protein
MTFYFLLFLTGLFGGFIAGFLGVGGGIIYILVLPHALAHVGVPEALIVQFTIANSILGTFFSSLFSTFNHWRNKEVYLRYILYISIIGTITSTLSLYFIVNTPFYERKQFNSVVIGLLLFMFISTLYRAKRDSIDVNEKIHPLKLMSIGAASGLVASLSGLGGGIVIIPLLNGVIKLNIKVAKTISLGVIMITSLAIIIYNSFEYVPADFEALHFGYLVPEVSMPIIIGAVLASTFGVKTSRKLKAEHISYIFAAFVFIVILKKAWELIQLGN